MSTQLTLGAPGEEGGRRFLLAIAGELPFE